MSKAEVKTNAMRILDKNKITYELLTYECDEFIDWPLRRDGPSGLHPPGA